MDLQFQGIDPVVSTLLLCSLALATLLISWWSYSHLKRISAGWRWSLISLRVATLLLLVLLLINPFHRTQQTIPLEPAIAVYLDDSRSMGLSRGAYDGLDSYTALLNRLDLDQLDADVRYYRFGSEVQPVRSATLALQENATRFDRIITHLSDQPEEVQAAVVISDGVITRGSDPLFAAHELRIPLFVVPAGDTSDVRDVAITDVRSNRTGHLQTRHPVEVSFRQQGFGGETVSVQLTKEGEVIQTQEITFEAESSVHNPLFYVEPEEPGIHTWQIQIPALADEQTDENNSRPFTIEITDEKTRIWHLAFEIHPDAGWIRRALSSNPNLDLHPRTWTGSGFLEGPLPASFADQVDLLILQGSIPDEAGLAVESLRTLPVLQFLTPGTSAEELTRSAIPLEGSDLDAPLNLFLSGEGESRDHPVLEQLRVFSTPTTHSGLHSSVTVTGVPASASVLLYVTSPRSENRLPLLIVEETQTVRKAVVTAWGWFRHGQSATDAVGDFTHRFLDHLISWSATSPGSRKLMISPGKPGYSEGEEMRFSGTLTGETGEPESAAAIEVVITDEGGEEIRYAMRNRGEGYYELHTRAPSAGSYAYRIEALKNGRIIDQASGEFNVVPSTQEFISTRRNDAMLRQLASVTGGEFIGEQSREQLDQSLRNRNLLEPLQREETSWTFLYRQPGWFILIVILLGSEWLIRRSLSLP